MREKICAAVLIVLALFPLSGTGVQAASVPVRHTMGEQSVLIIPVEFEDMKNSVSIQHLESLSHLANGYIKAASYNQT